eukprot:1406247-Lingulodinium_polyedra.AAC.1
MANKGRMWADTIQHLRTARREMKREKEKEHATPMSSKRKKERGTVHGQEMLANTLLECIQEGGLFECMAAAG